MTENIYSGFGSQFILEPEGPNSSDGTTNNAQEPISSRWRNLRLKMRYFTIQARPDDAKNPVHKNKSEPSTETEATTHEEFLLVETKSCESFYSCLSSASNTREKDKRSRNLFSANLSSDLDLHDQITLINAIFLEKKLPLKNQPDINNKISSKPEISNENGNSSSEKSSGDRNPAQASKDCEVLSDKQYKVPLFPLYSPPTKNLQNINKKHYHATTECTEFFHEKSIVAKPFKINRKKMVGTRKPIVSRIVSKRNHKMTIRTPQFVEKIEEKCSGDNTALNKILLLEEDELHKSIIFEFKQGISESYEIHFIEPAEQNKYSILFSSDNSTDNSDDEVFIEENISYQSGASEKGDSVDYFAKSILENKDSNINPSEDLERTQITFEPYITHSSDYENESSDDRDSVFDGQAVDRSLSFTILFEPDETKLNSSSNQTFEILFENGISRHEKIDDRCLDSEIQEEPLRTEEVLEESSENGMKEQTGETIDIGEENSANATTTPFVNPHSHKKRRRSSSRKSALPVIEESPELTQDVLDNDYCLVDTLGRSIYLFDHRGLPLTDSSGRPLRDVGGELLLKCDDRGVPVVDEETPIFDMYGRQPHEDGFQPWMSPLNSEASRLTLGDGRPLVLFDVEGYPLTSISGTMLVDSFGRTLLKLRNYSGQTFVKSLGL